MSQSVGLVVPAYFPDPARINAYINELWATVEPDTIRVEMDDPTGSQATLVESLDAEVSVTPYRRGKGKAITNGFEALDTDIMAFVDADGSTSAASVQDLLEPLELGGASITIASRHHPESTVSGRTRSRRFLSWGFATMASLATGFDISDFQCGAKALTADCWKEIKTELYEAGFGWDLELLWVANRHGFSIEEVPIEWNDAAGSTVPPLRTTAGLSELLVRISVARIRQADHWNEGDTPLVDQLETDTR